MQHTNLNIAVCGTHGKSSTSAMAGLFLDDAELDPSIVVGSIMPRYESNLKIGVVRVEKVQDGIAEIHININPTQRGKGYGISLLAKGVEIGFEKYDIITAKIIKENEFSIRTFEKVGFRRITENEEIIDYSIERSLLIKHVHNCDSNIWH